MGFDTKPDIELIEKGRPLWPHYWARTTVMTTAYGHGIAVTPLHLDLTHRQTMAALQAKLEG